MAIAGKMTKFRISELSGVNRPAQEGAKVTFMKRDASPDGGVARSSEENIMDKEIRKSLGLAETATDAEVIAALSKANKDAMDAKTKAEEAAEMATKKSAMTDAEKAHTAKMADAEVVTFLAKSAADRGAEIAKALAGDETFVSKGVTIRKSDVGSGVFELLKAQAAEIQENGAAIAKANEEARTARFEKQADSEFAHVAGTLAERAALLKAIDVMPEAVKKTAMANLVAQEALAKTAFARVGAGGGLEPGFAKSGGTGFTKADQELDRLAKEYETKNKVTYAKAYDAVLQANPALYEQSQQEARVLAAAN